MSKDSPLVSAIIITHNRSSLLKRAIESVINQTYKNIECIVVDDMSSDNTKDICKQYPSINYIYIPKEESKGGNYARNKGINNSNGEFIALLDDDDYWALDKIEKQIKVFKNEEIGIVYCGRTFELVNEKEISLKTCKMDYSFVGDLSTRIFESWVCTSSMIVVRKVLVYNIGMFDENLKFWQEYEFLIRLSKITKFGVVKEPLIFYRINKNDTQRLTNKYDDWWKSIHYINKKHHKRISELPYITKIKYRYKIYEDSFNRSRNKCIIIRKYNTLRFILINKYIQFLDNKRK